MTTVQAFFTVNPLNPPTRFAGLANFRALLHNPFVRQSAANTVLYIVVGVGLSTLFGLGIALVLQRRSHWRGIILALVVLPWALPAVVEAVIWGWIYDPTFGVLNSVLKSLGVINTYHVWVGIGRVLSIVLIELVQVWQITPLAALLILAALQSIPQELYEAARVDGAGRWEMFRRITLPLIRPGLAVAMVESLILSLNVFDQVYVLNGFAPGRRLDHAADLPDQLQQPELRPGLCALAAGHLRHHAALAAHPGRRLPPGGVLMRRARPARLQPGLLIALILVWSAFPDLLGPEHQLHDLNGGAEPCPPTSCRRPSPAHNYQHPAQPAAGGVGDQFWRSFLNSTIESGLATVLTVVIALFAAYAFARLEFRGKRVILVAGAGHAAAAGVCDPDPAVPHHVERRTW